jgi:hypothetical protein
VFFVHGFLFASWTAHIPQLKQHLGLSDGALGLALLGAPIGSVLAMVVAGRLLPTLGSRRILSLALVGYCVSGPFIGLTASLDTFFVAFLLWGFFQGMLDVSMNTQAITVERFSGRVLMPGFHGSWSTGALVGAVTGAVAVGLGVSLSEQMLVLAAPCLLVVGWLAARMIPDGRAGGDIESSVRTPDGRGGVLQGAVIALGLIVFADMLCEGAAADWGAVYLRNSLDAVPLVAGLAYAAYALAMLAVRLSGNRLFTRFPSPPSAARHYRLARVRHRARHRQPGERAARIRLARRRPRRCRPNDPQCCRSGEQCGNRKGSGSGGRLRLGRLRGGACRDRRDRINDDTPHRPVLDPSSYRNRRRGHRDRESTAAPVDRVSPWRGPSRRRRTKANLRSARYEPNPKSTGLD